MPPASPIDHSVPDKDEFVPVTATVDLAALRHNAGVLRAQADGANLMAIVKADAYGHGAVPVARVLHEEGIRHFAVARTAEAIQLREAGLENNILVLGAPVLDDLSVYSRYDLDMTVSSTTVAEAARRISRHAQPLRVHVKVDTGMARLGVSLDEAPEIIEDLATTPGIVLAGVWTHFATADQPQSAFAQTQLARFHSLLDELDTLSADVAPEHVHVANTGALLTMGTRSYDLPTPLIRTGIALYGLAPSAELRNQIDLRPVMRLRARVTHLRTVSTGTPVSYGAQWRAPRPSRIATLGAGYADGYPRLCSDRGVVRLQGEERPIVGTICMDMCMVDLGPPDHPLAQSVEVGDEAVLFGKTTPTLYDVAEWAETIPYELSCGVSHRVPRRYIDETTDHDATFRRLPPSLHDSIRF